MVIVVGLDISEHSRRAFERALDLAERMDGDLVLVHAVVPSAMAGGSGPIGEALLENDASEWHEVARHYLAAARGRVKAEAVARKGPAHAVLLHEAQGRNASLIVVGSHGRTGLKRLALGSVATALLHHSGIPVMVVPA